MLLDVPDRPRWRHMTYESEDIVDELKFFQDYRNPTVLTAGVGLFNMLPKIATGSGENQRLGNTISIEWIDVSWIANTTNEAIASPRDGLIRFLIFCDHQANGTTPVYGQIVDTNIGFTSGPYNRDYVPQQFEILHDEVIRIPTGEAVYNATTAVYSNKLGYKAGHVSLLGGPIKVLFNGTGSTAAAVNTGNIWCCFQSEIANVRVQLDHRVHYRDRGEF